MRRNGKNEDKTRKQKCVHNEALVAGSRFMQSYTVRDIEAPVVAAPYVLRAFCARAPSLDMRFFSEYNTYYMHI